MKKVFIHAFFILFFAYSNLGYSQEVYQNIDNKGIYDLIDELANCKIITINSVIKPYSRFFIAEKLKEASEKSDILNERQKKEIDFYMLDYAKELAGFEATDFFGKNLILKDKVPFRKRIDLFYYKDSLFNFTLNPVMGLEYFSNENGTNYHRWNGLEASGYVGKHWGFYSSLRDNHESELFALRDYLTQQTGGTYKEDGKGGGDYEKVAGGITYSWNWGCFGVIKDNIEWGNNYHGATIISNRAPSFPMIKLNMHPAKWFDFNYIHGWLPSLVVDSNRTYNYGYGNRIIYHDKYIAANMFTIIPFKNLNFSFGNSVVYSDIGVQPGFLIPVIFFKSVDHSMNGMNNKAGQNAQMFFDISSRQIKHLHMFAALFVDEISLSNMTDKEKQSNFISFKCGLALSDLFIQNLTCITEYTRTNPMVYRHFIPTTTFESNNYFLGDYLGDNAEESFIELVYKPLRGLNIAFSYNIAQKGPEYIYDGLHQNVVGLPWLNYITWYNKTLSGKISYQFFNDMYIFCGYSNSFTKDDLKKYTPKYFQGKTNTISFGLNWGY
jgi:hypothetical protein